MQEDSKQPPPLEIVYVAAMEEDQTTIEAAKIVEYVQTKIKRS